MFLLLHLIAQARADWLEQSPIRYASLIVPQKIITRKILESSVVLIFQGSRDLCFQESLGYSLLNQLGSSMTFQKCTLVFPDKP